MKFIHTADWHLGKLVHGVYMTEDQRHVLQQLLAAIEEEKPDAVLLAGDVYDRAVPPTEAVALLDEVYRQIVVELKTPLLAISGNHDSPERMQFAASILGMRGLHLAGYVQAEPQPVVLHDEHGEVHVYLVPYADPSQVRHVLGDERIRTHQDAMAAIVARIEARKDSRARHVFMGHAFVTPHGEPAENTSDAERPLSLGGAEQVSAELFANFAYTALGHLHQAHHVGEAHIRYAGSLLKYSVSEQHHQKGFSIVEMDAAGQVTVEHRLFQARRDMRVVSGLLREIEQHAYNEDYVFVELLDESPILFPMEKVRKVYPNAMHVERRLTRSAAAAGGKLGQVRQAERLHPGQQFAAFYEEVTGAELSATKRARFAELYEQVVREEGERK